MDNITVLTCNFNNNDFTRWMSITLYHQLGIHLPTVVMDNGNKSSLTEDDRKTFKVIDNTNFKLTPDHHQGSRNHCHSLDYALKNIITTKWVLVCDNDIVFKPSIKQLIGTLNSDVDCYGEIGWDGTPPNRIFPYFFIINHEKFISDKLDYYDESRILKWYIDKDHLDPKYNYMDTGYSFYEDIKAKHWNIKPIKMDDYIIHLKSAALHKKDFIEWYQSTRKLIL